ncbi:MULTISPECIES: methylated-DNA--[protein]-cysteine S-methyltransferase [unclassified Streptomyces]|uniref:methylated-DNA--[protein]-cysteine S-methyltransferase n=1 Tax=unclassified Streptomyces TaxID=2593676 RepID=UPI002E2B08A4|nr:methylated-DNA--[protein]-cysteine S-methyltransferase [Streptomyces sp. NBC_00223]
MTIYSTVDSPLGELLLVGEARDGGGVVLDSVSVPGQRKGAVVGAGWQRAPHAFGAVTAQLEAYFAGTLTRFEVGTTTRGTDFQRRVWAALEAIPYGVTTSYGRLAERIGAPRAAVRALGSAIGANPLLIVRPCHRVIGADGSLTGYAGGLDRKRRLLALEGAWEDALEGAPR